MRDFKNLEIWNEAHQLVLKVYKNTSTYPSDQKFGLIRQMRNSSSSIPTNISEGCGRGSNKELRQFCIIAMGSGSELEYQLLLSNDLGYLEDSTYGTLQTELISLKKRPNAFIRHLTTPKS